MNTKNNIALNFFPLTQQEFDFKVFRRQCQQSDKRIHFPDCSRRKLPKEIYSSDESLEYYDYWISYEPKAGFEEYSCASFANIYLTLDLLHRLLVRICENKLQSDEYKCNDGFRKRVFFVLHKYPEGDQTIWLEPYFLRVRGKFGFLADFKFYTPPNTKSTRRIQQLSLSLDKDGRSNKNFYAERFEKIQDFISKFHHRIFSLALDSLDITIDKTLFDLEPYALRPKTYVFAEGKTSKSQFNGIKSHGPLRTIKDNTKVYFVYRKQDKPFSYDLFRALKGDTFRTFLGMEKMFCYELNNQNVGGISTDDFNPESLEKTIKSIRQDAGNRPVVPIIITPFSKEGGPQDNKNYYIAKHTLLKHRVPSQFVSLRRLQVKNELKWATSNIGLQLFAKMGGQPWKVAPQTNSCLIVGLGQAHRRNKERIEKYFAYSILTESTGLYKDLRVLSETTEEDTYLNNFRDNLKAIFEEYYDTYDNFVVHATFSIRKDELEAVKNILDTLSSMDQTKKKFVAMKFNDRNKFFGYATSNNSMVPYESSYIRLSDKEYLVWFEGLQYHNPNIRKRVERPLHIEFIYPDDGLSEAQMQNYLQDAVNLSGANWRGFNAKSLPVSVYYAYLVASYYKEFQALGLDEIDLDTMHPWFL